MVDKLDTLALHAGSQKHAKAVATPVFHSSTYEMSEGVAYRDIRYARLGNSPNHEVLHARLAKLCSAEMALTCGSGMAAIYTALDELVPTGGRILVASTLYGGTSGLLARWQAAERVFIDTFDAAKGMVEGQSDYDVVYVETIANPTIQPAHLPKVAEIAAARGAKLVVDNTFGSPVMVQPTTLGADVVVHSATKYLNGHSDVTAGVIAGRADLLEPMRTRLAYNGAMLDPGAAYLLERGMKTLGVRYRRQAETAAWLVSQIRERSDVPKVYFPDLDDAPWLRSSGAMFSFELPEDVNPAAFFDALKYFTYAPSLGGVESLIIRPAFASHAGMSSAEREAMGISDGLVRVSCGLEDPNDLRDDLFEALAKGER